MLSARAARFWKVPPRTSCEFFTSGVGPSKKLFTHWYICSEEAVQRTLRYVACTPAARSTTNLVCIRFFMFVLRAQDTCRLRCRRACRVRPQRGLRHYRPLGSSLPFPGPTRTGAIRRRRPVTTAAIFLEATRRCRPLLCRDSPRFLRYAESWRYGSGLFCGLFFFLCPLKNVHFGRFIFFCMFVTPHL